MLGCATAAPALRHRQQLCQRVEWRQRYRWPITRLCMFPHGMRLCMRGCGVLQRVSYADLLAAPLAVRNAALKPHAARGNAALCSFRVFFLKCVCQWPVLLA